MSKMSLIDKLGILWKISKSSYLFIVVILVLLVLGFIFLTTNKKNYKRNKLIYLISIVVITTIMIAYYHGSLNNLYKYMMDNLFIAIYFPNLAIYFAAMVITNIILWISLFNFKTTEIAKKINIVVYIILNYLLALLLNVINTSKLDIFNQSSIYGNKNARALIELSSLVFVIWIIFLVVYKIILIYVRKDYKPKMKKVIIKKKVKLLPENYEPVSIPSYVYSNKKKEKIIITEPIKSHIIEPVKEFANDIKETMEETAKPIIIEPVKEETIKPIVIEPVKAEVKRPVIAETVKTEPAIVIQPQEERLVIDTKEIVEKPEIIATTEDLNNNFEQMLTVDDYKLLLKMLQEQKEKEKLEKQKQEEKKKEEDKFMELQALYRGAR